MAGELLGILIEDGVVHSIDGIEIAATDEERNSPSSPTPLGPRTPNSSCSRAHNPRVTIWKRRQGYSSLLREKWLAVPHFAADETGPTAYAFRASASIATAVTGGVSQREAAGEIRGETIALTAVLC